MFWEEDRLDGVKVKFQRGREGGEGELRRSGKVSILSLLFRYLWDGRECTICNNDNKKVGDLGVGV